MASLPPGVKPLSSKVRGRLYWVAEGFGEVAAYIIGIVAIVAAASPDWALSPWWGIVASVLLMASSRLHRLAGQNVTPT